MKINYYIFLLFSKLSFILKRLKYLEKKWIKLFKRLEIHLILILHIR